MTQYFSAEGLQKLKEELEERKNKLRGEIAKRISEAKALGDLSENAEYTEAKEMQAFNEGRIEELDEIVKSAIVIDPHKKSDTVLVGSTVAVSSKRGEQKFTIVGSSEAVPAQGLISNESPLGQAFLGRKKGEEFDVQTPAGVAKYKVLSID